MADPLPGLEPEPEPERTPPPPAWCQGERNKPYTSPNWDIWVTDRDRAFCRHCGRDVHPAACAQLYATARAAESVEETRFKLVERWDDCPLCGNSFRRAREDWWPCLSCSLLGDTNPELDEPAVPEGGHNAGERRQKEDA